jgi:hypothetical protein
MAHPLLLSLANLKMRFCMKASNHAFVLLALLPVPSFIHRDRKMRSVLENRLIHECLDFILKPLKIAAEIGIMMSDPLRHSRHIFTPLATYIVDTPESAVLAGVGGKTSSVTMANYKQFGDPFQHEPRTASTTLAQLNNLEQTVDPWDLEAYIKSAFSKFRLNGVHRPFWTRLWHEGDLYDNWSAAGLSTSDNAQLQAIVDRVREAYNVGLEDVQQVHLLRLRKRAPPHHGHVSPLRTTLVPFHLQSVGALAPTPPK